jgi:serine/threonine protein kinase
MITVYTSNGKAVKLDDTKPLGCGGEGVVFLKGGLTYKKFHDPANMIPILKMKELSALSGTNVIVPLETIHDIKGGPAVGFTSEYVKNAQSMAKFFTNGFRIKNSITPEMTVTLAENFIKMVKLVHSNSILVVDMNEFNFLVSESDLVTPWGIDTSSYQTPSFPATAIMPHVMDWGTTGFTEFSDWFSAGILLCQLFIGEHPFKGEHSKFSKNDFRGRQLAHLSIFNPAVKVRKNVRPFSLIPSQFMNWFVAMFEKGMRCLPPDTAGAFSVETIQTQTISGCGVFVITLIEEYDGNIIWYKNVFGRNVCLTDTHIYIDKTKIKSNGLPKLDIIFSPISITPIAINIDAGESMSNIGIVKIVNINTNTPVIGVTLKAVDKFVLGNRLYLISEDKLIEVVVKEIGTNIVTAISNTWSINGIGSEVFDGVIYSPLMGKPYLTIPYDEKKCSTISIPELDGYRIIDGKYENGICIFIAMSKNGEYNRIILSFNLEHTFYEYTIENNVAAIDINFTVLDNGIVILFDDSDNILLFNKGKIDDRKQIVDPNMNVGYTLCRAGNNVRMFSGNKLLSVTMGK